jgi:hypothetical protein
MNHQDSPDDGQRFIKGLRYGLSLAIPFWLLILALMLAQPRMAILVEAIP